MAKLVYYTTEYPPWHGSQTLGLLKQTLGAAGWQVSAALTAKNIGRGLNYMSVLEIIFDLPFSFPTNNIISLYECIASVSHRDFMIVRQLLRRCALKIEFALLSLFASICADVSLQVCVSVYGCVCVCVAERERERERVCVSMWLGGYGCGCGYVHVYVRTFVCACVFACVSMHICL